MNIIRTLIAFAVFMFLFIAGAAIGGGYGAVAGFVIGVGAMFAIASGKLDLVVRPLRNDLGQ